MPRTYRVALLGCRARGTIIGRAYHRHLRTELVALCDLMPERRDTLGNELGVNARYDDLHRMIEETSPDIVAVPTGTEFHFDLCMAVLEHGGIHLDVEKPITVDLNQADALLAKAQKVGSKIAVHHQGRSGPALRAVAKLVNEGRIGEPRYVRASGKGYYGGYGLMNVGTHVVNAMMEITGPCRRILASVVTAGHPITPQDVLQAPSGMGIIAGEHITATLEFSGGMLGTLAQHRFGSVDAAAMGFEVLGDGGRVAWNQQKAAFLPVPHDTPAFGPQPWEQLTLTAPPGVEEGNAEEHLYIEDFVQALDSDGEHPSCGAQGRHVLEVLMGIFESGAYARPVMLPLEHRDHPLVRWRKETQAGPMPQMPRPYREWLQAEGKRLGWSPSHVR